MDRKSQAIRIAIYAIALTTVSIVASLQAARTACAAPTPTGGTPYHQSEPLPQSLEV